VLIRTRAALVASLVAVLVLPAAPVVASSAAVSTAAEPSVSVHGLTVDGLTNPLGIDDVTPRLSWQLSSDGAGVVQTAYEVRAASSGSGLGHPDLWDSGRVSSAESVNLNWAGAKLISRAQVFWQVRTWNQSGNASGWSAPAHFEMGLLSPQDWDAQWIGNSDWLDRKPEPVTVDVGANDARYVQLTTTRLGLPLKEGSSLLYRLQLAEIVVEDSAQPDTDLALGAAISSSDPKTYPGSWEPRFAVDGSLTSNNAQRGYSSAGYSAATLAKPITLTIDLGQVRHFDRILLYGRTDTTTSDGRTPNFPSDFTVSTAGADGAYTTAATVTGQKEPPAYNIDLPALPLFAKQFTVDKPVRSARLYTTGLGIYDAKLNGDAVSKAVLQPANTDYNDRIEYSTNDVTKLLRKGGNALSVRLGAGISIVPDTPDRYTKWSGIFGPPKLLAQLEITYADGSTQRIVSDDSWRTTLGPTVFSQWYGGEDYDARLAQTGWDKPGANLTSWQQAATTTPPAATTKLTAQMDPPIEPVDVLHTVAVTEPKPGTYLFDLGTNFAGWPELHVSGPAGTTITLKPGERLGSDGLVDQSTMIKGGATYPPILDHYTLSGHGSETWHPDFVYHGFRYLQVTGLPSGASNKMVDGIVLRAANDNVGTFDSSSDLLNSIHRIIDRAVQGNMYSVLTDCPNREKLGWLEETHLEFDTVARNYDVAAYYRQLVRNMAEAQESNGMVPAIAPLVYNVFGGNPDQVGEPNWGSAIIMAPWQMYRTYGDVQTLRTYYSNMQRYLVYLQGRSSGDLLNYGLGDWGAIDTSTPLGVAATYALHQDAVTMASIAKVLGKDADAQSYADLGTSVANAYNAKYLDAVHHTYANGTQAADAFSLDMGIVPDDQRAAVTDHLVASIRAAGNHLTVGEIALPSVFRVLSAAHRDDVIYDIASQTTNPSYGYSVVHGATALPEYWDGSTGYGSQDHFMMGAIEQWFSGALGGIQQADDSVAYRDLVISPRVVGNLTHADSTYDTPYGAVRSSWQLEGTTYQLDVTVPANSTATVQVPTWAGQGDATSTNGIKPAGSTPYATVFNVGSGHWQFVSHMPNRVPADTVQLAIQAPTGAIPLVAGQPGTATFSVYSLMDHAVSVRPTVSVSDGFSATQPATLNLPAHQAVNVPITVTVASDNAQTGTLQFSAGDATASATLERTDDLVRIATMSASSTHAKWDPARAGDGITAPQQDYASWNSGGGWNDGTSGAFPDTLTATWQDPVTVDRAVVYTIDASNQTAAQYGLRDYDVQVLQNGSWTTVASVRANTQGTVTSTFPETQASALRLVISDTNDHTYSRVVELEAYAS